MLNRFKRSKLNTAEIFGLALGGLHSATNKEKYDRLKARKNRQTCLDYLDEGWGIKTLDDFQRNDVWLDEDGHSGWAKHVLNTDDYSNNAKHLVVQQYAKEIAATAIRAFDLGRRVQVVRWAFTAYLITEEAAWELIHQVASKAQEHYNSWEDYLDDFLLGYRFFYADVMEHQDYFEALLEEMRQTNTIWSTTPWGHETRTL